jgi:glycine/D-amino acid oxidase-like deaminating enzyme
MQRTSPSSLPIEQFDLIVIGGGINGVAIARDAAMRGLHVCVLEKEDLASGTTSWATRLIHGGLRYLEHREFRLVRESLRERERLLHDAPHLVTPLPLIRATMMLSTFKGSPRPSCGHSPPRGPRPLILSRSGVGRCPLRSPRWWIGRRWPLSDGAVAGAHQAALQALGEPLIGRAYHTAHGLLGGFARDNNESHREGHFALGRMLPPSRSPPPRGSWRRPTSKGRS